ncbi:ShlB/FhaC/HecB family hemolysin secretion/activation protein [uncultured Phenylobacterium sp.]|uniref:ShlB/FhaC/HecB family hemolysin secretion/activation protein n=1 Tax=uncultured Phenylobacterium sp. TaxID=349273 RepID=UPI0025EEF5EE|nr:ShlB/FhaC/HecB family hemolysin secretion/activation protein [uncultured Phenylobacterium sp.]
MSAGVWGFAATLAFGAGLAQAQPAAPLGERTGPNRAPQAVPSPARPAPAQLPEVVPTAPRSPTSSGIVRLSDVRVTVEPAQASAPAPADWRPVADAPTGLKLDLRPGERLDGAWVRSQFADNGLIGSPAPLDRLVALAQLINLTLVRHGLINSGVRLEGALPADGGVLDVRLVLGRSIGPDGEPVVVAFGPRGSRGLSAAYIRARLPSAAAVPFNAQAVEREFRLLAQDPAIRTINANLRPGQAPGQASLQITVEPQARLDLYASAANSRSPSIGGERYAVGGSFRNLAVAGDLVSGEYGRTAGREDFLLGYEGPFLSPRTTISARGGRNEAAVVESALRPLGIRSRDWFIDGGVTHKLIDTPLAPLSGGGIAPARTLSVGMRVTHREQRTYLLGQPFSFGPGSVDGRSQYTAARLTADYVERGVRQVLVLSATATLGLDGTRTDIPGLHGPESDFKVALVQASYARRLTRGGLELRGRLAAQIADGPLYSGERFSAGGENSVRGYRENLLLADNGAFGSLELAQPFNLGDQAETSSFRWGAITASAFLDAAWVDNRRGLDPTPRSIASLGASLAWTPSDALFVRLTYGAALRDVPVSGGKDLQDRGFHFRVTLRPLALR